MDEILYESLCRYFNALSKVGSVSYSQVNKLLVLMFYKHFIYEDYRGYISREDYSSIEKALECLFGSTCLIPYPVYLKMGQLHLGDLTELSQRIDNTEARMKALEDVKVVKGKQDVGTVEDIDLPSIL